MRIEALQGCTRPRNNHSEPSDFPADYGGARNARHPELADLLIAKEANALFNCPLLARDELEFANFMINKLDVDPHYIPSITLLTAVRNINAKLAIWRNQSRKIGATTGTPEASLLG
jgi:hypothetical protein